MDRIAFILFLLFAPGVLAQTDWGGRFEILPNPWRGTIQENRQPFDSILDDGPNNGKISLRANPVIDRRLAGYKLHYGTETGVYTMTHDCKKTLEKICTVSGLTNGTTYYFVAVAYGRDPAITSGYSNEVSGAP
jgi:hypothetical protein